MERKLRQWKKPPSNVSAILIDAPTAGGGEVFNRKTFRELRANGFFADLPPVIIAGGLNMSNVAEIIRELNPWDVDVSSGVESERGIKSPELVQKFCRSARGASELW